METIVTEPMPADEALQALSAIERRVLWLAVRIVDYANRERPKGDALKVGGHQASSASMVTLMTALWLADMDARDRVSVKPHASPVMHALEYLLGRLDRSYLTRLRDFGGLQSLPVSARRIRSPSTTRRGRWASGSAAPLFGALADRYVETHFGTPRVAGSSRCSAMRSSTRGTSGRRSPSRSPASSGTSSGSSTSTDSRSTG